MISAPIPANEVTRIQGLHELGILDTPEEDEFTDVVELASRICKTPISLISLVDYSRQWFKARVGIDVSEAPRDISFCGHAIVEANPFFEVPDALEDARFVDNPFVTGEPNIRFYAGVQLLSKKGSCIGMLCVNDTKPNKLNDEQIFALKVLGNHVVKLMDLRITKKKSEEKSKKIESQNEVLRKMLSIIAHDVRGPIGSLKQILELSETGMLDTDAQKEMLTLSKYQVNNVLTLLNNLVDWGKVKVKDESPKTSKVNLKQIAAAEINYITISASLKNNAFKNLIDENTELEVDPDMIQFIIRNLISNANKFTRDGRIIIFSDNDGLFTKLAINDSGTGMTQQMIENLLEKNKMITTPGTDNEKGSGIGFKLIKEFMENIGGRIQINSEPGVGTTVILSFPNKRNQ